jgi:ribA/ribD-fused uncharacterized protein
VQFCNLIPSQAKHLGRHVALRKDWEDIKEKVMYDICLNKFTTHPDLLGALLDTGDAILIEGNTWGDREWGQVDSAGKNKLGKILMRIRGELASKDSK